MAKQQHNPNVVKNHRNINHCTLKDLHNIQGIGRETAERVMQLRKEHGPIENASQLKRLGNFDNETIRKLQKGITFH